MNTELAYNIYRPEDYALGIVQIIHGMSEYGQRYEKFAQYLCKKGFVVITYDHRGHGATCSEENLGFFDSKDGWYKLIEDAHSITDVVKKEYPPDVPFILFGHSMGSLVARSYCKRFDYELNGLILCGAPCYQAAAPLGVKVAQYIAKRDGEKARSSFLENLATGKFSKAIENSKTPLDWLSKNEDNVVAYMNDPLCGFPFTNRGYEDLFRLVCDMNKLSGWKKTNKELPIYFIAGEDDPCTGGKKGLMKSQKRLKRAGYRNISEHIYPGLRHELLNEKEYESIFEDVYQWICNFCINKNS